MPRGVTPEAIQDWLDDLGLPYRRPLGVLIRDHGTEREAWTDALTRLRLPGRPPVPGLEGAPFVQVGPRSDPHRAPPLIECRLRGPSSQANLAVLVGAVEARFGPGRDSSASNTREVTWGDDHAFVRARIWPPERNLGGTNARHAVDPGAATEACLDIAPDWWPPLTAEEGSALAGWAPVLGPPEMQPIGDGISRPLAGQPAGTGLSGDGLWLVAVTGAGRGVVVPRARLVSGFHDRLDPARGPGGVSIGVTLRAFGPDSPERGLTFLRGPPEAPGQTEVVAWMRQALGLEVRETVAPDC